MKFFFQRLSKKDNDALRFASAIRRLRLAFSGSRDSPNKAEVCEIRDLFVQQLRSK